MTRKEVIGDCTLYCGDCRDIMPGLGEFDAVITDPPYGMAFQSNHRNLKHAEIANDKSDDLLQWACRLRARHSLYVFCRWDNLAEVPKPKSCVTWVKNNWSMGDLNHEHARQTEIILFFPGPGHRFPDGRPADVISAARTGNFHHPTEKPVSLMKAVAKWTEGVVFDPFMGSGTTGVACTEMGRKFIGVELVPEHFETACERLEAAYRQPDMFVSNGASRPTQLSMI